MGSIEPAEMDRLWMDRPPMEDFAAMGRLCWDAWTLGEVHLDRL